MTETKKTTWGNEFVGAGVIFFFCSVIAFYIMLKEEYLLALGVEILIIGFLTMLVMIGIGYVIKELHLLRMDLDKFLSKKENP